MLAMACRSSAGMPKAIHLAVDWHHNESPPCGRSAVAAEECEAPFAVNIRKEFEKCKPRRTVLLTKSARSPESGRSQAEGGRSGLTGPTTTTLRGRARRTGWPGNVCRNSG